MHISALKGPYLAAAAVVITLLLGVSLASQAVAFSRTTKYITSTVQAPHLGPKEGADSIGKAFKIRNPREVLAESPDHSDFHRTYYLGTTKYSVVKTPRPHCYGTSLASCKYTTFLTRTVP